MATTTLFVELIVIGAQGLLWLGLAYTALSGIPPSLSLDKASAPLILFPMLAMCYVLGTILDGLYRYVGFRQIEHALRRKAVESILHKKVPRNSLYEEWALIRHHQIKSTGPEWGMYAYFRHRIRLLRASSINFLLTGLGLWFFCSRQESIKIPCSWFLIASLFVLAALSFVVWWRLTRGWTILSCRHYSQDHPGDNGGQTEP